MGIGEVNIEDELWLHNNMCMHCIIYLIQLYYDI